MVDDARSDPGSTPPLQAPCLLAALEGARPPAPAWFEGALAEAPQRTVIQVADAPIELLTWGPVGGPGLLLLHGAGAHAGWWSFIAPFFAWEGWRVAAPSWSGMGGSGWRERYGFDTFAQEAVAAAEAAGLFAGGAPTVVAHSFGGAIVNHLAASEAGDRFARFVLADVGVRAPGKRWRGPPPRSNPNRVYPTQAAALARFRLAPPQDCANLYAVDHVARGGLRAVEGGLAWSFDPFIWARLDAASRPLSQEAELAQARAPLAFLYGDRSALMDADAVAYTRANAAPGTPFVALPQAAHHLMLDQPIAFVAALRSLLTCWPHTQL